MLNLNDINATVREKFIPVAVENIFQKIFLINRLVKRNKIIFDAPGKDGYISQPIIADKYPIYSHDNQMGKLQVPVKDILTYAKFEFATRYGSLPLTRKDENILNSKEAVVNTLAIRMKTLTTSLIDQIETQLFTQTTVSEGAEIDSLAKIVDNGDNYASYAGLNRTDFPDWKSYVLNKNNTSVTFADLSNVYNEASIGEAYPTLIITTPTLWTAVNQIIFDKQRYVLQDDEVAQLGKRNFKLFEAPCVASKRVPAGQIIFLNEDYLYIVLKKDADEKGMTFIPYERVDLATVKAAHLFWDGQLYCNSPRLQAKIINVAA